MSVSSASRGLVQPGEGAIPEASIIRAPGESAGRFSMTLLMVVTGISVPGGMGGGCGAAGNGAGAGVAAGAAAGCVWAGGEFRLQPASAQSVSRNATLAGLNLVWRISIRLFNTKASRRDQLRRDALFLCGQFKELQVRARRVFPVGRRPARCCRLRPVPVLPVRRVLLELPVLPAHPVGRFGCRRAWRTRFPRSPRSGRGRGSRRVVVGARRRIVLVAANQNQRRSRKDECIEYIRLHDIPSERFCGASLRNASRVTPDGRERTKPESG